jgi:branched-chain amino acid transport system substrate-binding protein
MKKRILFTLLMVALSVTAGFAQDEWGTITIPKDQPIHLGFSAALTGDYANYGIDQQKGVELALEDVQNTVLGFKVELQAQDDQCEGAPAMAIAEKFCADPLFVGMVGFHCSGGSIPASKTLEKNGFSMVSPASTNAQLTARGMQNVFRTCFNDSVQAEVGAQYAANTLKLKTAVVLHDNSQYGQPLGQTFQAIFESLGGKVLAFEGVTRGDKDFRPILTKIKPMNPQIVYFGGMSAEAVLILRQMRDLGMKAAFMSDDGCASVQDYRSGRRCVGWHVCDLCQPDGRRL